MTDPTPTRCRFYPPPAWLIFGLLVVEGLLWLSERYRWFSFNEKKGWTVLIGVAVVGLVMLGWFLVSLIFRWRFQFSIRSLLVLAVAVALPFSWMAVEMKRSIFEQNRWHGNRHAPGDISPSTSKVVVAAPAQPRPGGAAAAEKIDPAEVRRRIAALATTDKTAPYDESAVYWLMKRREQIAPPLIAALDDKNPNRRKGDRRAYLEVH
jgi:hypothetical protein